MGLLYESGVRGGSHIYTFPSCGEGVYIKKGCTYLGDRPWLLGLDSSAETLSEKTQRETNINYDRFIILLILICIYE